MSKENELLPCPFCGGEASLRETNWVGFPIVECVNYGKWIDKVWHPELGCKVRPSTSNQIQKFTGKTREEIQKEAISAWNTRANDLKEEIREHREHYGQGFKYWTDENKSLRSQLDTAIEAFYHIKSHDTKSPDCGKGCIEEMILLAEQTLSKLDGGPGEPRLPDHDSKND